MGDPAGTADKGVAVLIMVACGILLAAGLAAGVRWSTITFVAPTMSHDPTATEVARTFVWYVALALTAGTAAGISVLGTGGRLAMRLLAVTGGDDAQARPTEAGEVVGRITLDGTVGFVLFNGIFLGVLTGGLFLLIRRYLPAGPMGGVAFGLGLLIVFGAVIDPLRKENPDFDIVGPGWLSVLAFTALAVAFGLTLEGVTARASSWLPLPATDHHTLARYVVPAALAALAFVFTALLAALCLAIMAATRWAPLVRAVRSPRWTIGGRVVVIAVVVSSLPNAVGSMVDIIGR